jgi:hypothetical protein
MAGDRVPFPAWALALVINWLMPCMYRLSVRDRRIHSRSISAQKTIVAQKYQFWKTLLYNNNWKFEIGSPSHINEDTIF